MKKEQQPTEDEMRPEYRREDLGKGVRGKYYEPYKEGTLLDIGSLKPEERRNNPNRC